MLSSRRVDEPRAGGGGGQPVRAPQPFGPSRSRCTRGLGSRSSRPATRPASRAVSRAIAFRILTQADACKKPGELGSPGRSSRGCTRPCSPLNWRRPREAGRLALVTAPGRRRGPKPRLRLTRGSGTAQKPRTVGSAAAPSSGPRRVIHAPKKSCRDPGDPPETPSTPTSQRLDDRHRARTVTTTGAPRPSARVSASRAFDPPRRRLEPVPVVDADPTRGGSRALGPADASRRARRRCTAAVRRQRPPKCRPRCREEQTYLAPRPCTMYRILDAAEEVRARRAQARTSAVRETGSRRGDGPSESIEGRGISPS